VSADTGTGTEPEWHILLAEIFQDLARQLPVILIRMERACPGKLCIDGREYHRRQVARKRRKRRHRGR
jgi:hypothetical protein